MKELDFPLLEDPLVVLDSLIEVLPDLLVVTLPSFASELAVLLTPPVSRVLVTPVPAEVVAPVAA